MALLKFYLIVKNYSDIRRYYYQGNRKGNLVLPDKLTIPC